MRKKKLYGIGIGPGDPQLLTLKAKNILEKVPVIFVPKSHEDRHSRAESIIREVITPQTVIRPLLFPMSRDKKVLNHFWDQAAEEIINNFETIKEAAFVTLGDPLIYSTYIYLLYALGNKKAPIEIETVPGITSFCTAASCGNLPLVEADECLSIVPVVQNPPERVEEILKNFETTVLMKIGIRLPQVIEQLEELNLLKNALLVSNAGYAQQLVTSDLNLIKEENKGYLAVIIVKNPNAGKKYK